MSNAGPVVSDWTHIANVLGSQQTTLVKISNDNDGMVDKSVPVSGRAPTNGNDSISVFHHNAMELQGTVSPDPLGVNGLYPVDFSFIQKKWGYWKDSIGGGQQFATWVADNGTYFGTPENTLAGGGRAAVTRPHIYSLDGPGPISNIALNGRKQFLQVANFKDYAQVKLYGLQFQVSKWYTWHSEMSLIADAAGRWVRGGAGANSLDAGWVNI